MPLEKYGSSYLGAMLLSCVLACDTKPPSDEFDDVDHLSEEAPLVVQEVVRLRVMEKGYLREFIYQGSTDSLASLFVTQNLTTDSALKVNDEVFYFESRKTFSFGNKSKEVKRYFCSELEGPFAMMTMYFVDTYGMVALKDRLGITLFSRGRDSDNYLVECLRSDSTGFYKFKKSFREHYSETIYQLDSL